MATPVPVVSMMYFLVSRPPKTLVAVSPAFSAMSVKCASGGLELDWATENAVRTRTTQQSHGTFGLLWRLDGYAELITCRHAMVRAE